MGCELGVLVLFLTSNESEQSQAPDMRTLSSKPDFVEITKFVKDQSEAVETVILQLENANEEIIGLGNKDAPNLIFNFSPYREALLEVSKRIKSGRYITEVTSSNIKACKFLIEELHVQVHDLQGNKSNILITEKEFSSDLSTPHSNSATTKLLYSNSPELIAQQRELFETLWSITTPAAKKIDEIETGIEREETKVLGQFQEVNTARFEMANEARRELLVFLPSVKRLEATDNLFGLLAQRVLNERIRVRLLISFPDDSPEGRAILNKFSMFEFRKIAPIKLGMLIQDSSKLLFTQYNDIDNKVSSESIASGIYTTNRETISSIISIFETMWADSELREKEAKSRKQAELLQDILTHDIRNYNQVARLSAELLKEELKTNAPVQSIVEGMLQAVDGSTRLLERAKKLGKVISEEHPSLYAVNLKESVKSALQLVRMSYPDKQITTREDFTQILPCAVLADDLLNEVFTNIFSNSVRYTEGTEVEIEIMLEIVSRFVV